MNPEQQLIQRYAQFPKELNPMQVLSDGKALMRSARKSVVLGIDTTSSQKIFTFRITTNNLDRYNDVVDPKGAVLDYYLQNPVVLANHNSWSEWAIGKSLDLKPVDVGIDSQVQFHAETELSREAEVLVEKGYLNTASIGFIPLKITERQATEDEILYPSWTYSVMEFAKWEMLEWSVVNIPANPHALVQNDFYQGIRNAMDDNILTADSAFVKKLIAESHQIQRNRVSVKSITKVTPMKKKSLTAEEVAAADAVITESVIAFVKETLMNDYSVEEAQATEIATEYAAKGSEVLNAKLADGTSTATDSSTTTDTGTTTDTTTQSNSSTPRVTKSGNRNNSDDQARINQIAQLAAELGATNITLNEEPTPAEDTPAPMKSISVDEFIQKQMSGK